MAWIGTSHLTFLFNYKVKTKIMNATKQGNSLCWVKNEWNKRMPAFEWSSWLVGLLLAPFVSESWLWALAPPPQQANQPILHQLNYYWIYINQTIYFMIVKIISYIWLNYYFLFNLMKCFGCSGNGRQINFMKWKGSMAGGPQRNLLRNYPALPLITLHFINTLSSFIPIPEE